MGHQLIIKEEAKKDIIEAAHWYSLKVKGLEVRFIQQLEIVVTILLDNPKTYKKIYKHFRQAALKKFPYVVVYEYEEDVVIIYSVFHAKQNPGKKIKRLRR